MKRIVVIGAPAAGKSTLAAQVGQILGIEVFHLDELYWHGGDSPQPEEWVARQRDLLARPAWIIDGNYSGTLAERLDAADTVVFLDLSTSLSVLRLIRRRLAYRKGGVPGMASERRPYVNLRVLRHIRTFRADHRPWFLQMLSANAEGRRIVVLRSRADVRRFRDEVRRSIRP